MSYQKVTDQAASPEIRVFNPSINCLRIRHVMAKVKMSRAWIFESSRRGKFPARTKLGSASVWIESEVDQWLAEQILKGREPV